VIRSKRERFIAALDRLLTLLFNLSKALGLQMISTEGQATTSGQDSG
jgi:hypothetical protein